MAGPKSLQTKAVGITDKVNPYISFIGTLSLENKCRVASCLFSLLLLCTFWPCHAISTFLCNHLCCFLYLCFLYTVYTVAGNIGGHLGFI